MRRLFSFLIRKLDIVSLSARISSAKLAAACFSILSTKIDKGAKHTILCIGRPIFDDDVAAMSSYGGKINYIIFPKSILRDIYAVHLGEGAKCNIRQYHEEKIYREHKKRYYKFLSSVLPLIREKFKFGVVLSGNHVYPWQQEFAQVCLDSEIPFLILYKEGMAPLGSFDKIAKFYSNKKFIATKLLAYNENIKAALSKADILGLDEHNISVVGVPRLDRYIREKTIHGKSVIFFSFYPEDKFRHLNEDKEIYAELIQRSDKFHAEVGHFAANNPDINVIIKTKSSPKYLTYVDDILSKNNVKLGENLKLTNSGNAFDLLKSAKVVIGFNSTTLIEALLAGRGVVVPDLGEKALGPETDYFSNNAELVSRASDAQDIQKIYYESIDIELDREQQSQFLESYMYIPDGDASTRAESEIIQAIEG